MYLVSWTCLFSALFYSIFKKKVSVSCALFCYCRLYRYKICIHQFSWKQNVVLATTLWYTEKRQIHAIKRATCVGNLNKINEKKKKFKCDTKKKLLLICITNWLFNNDETKKIGNFLKKNNIETKFN